MKKHTYFATIHFSGIHADDAEEAKRIVTQQLKKGLVFDEEEEGIVISAEIESVSELDISEEVTTYLRQNIQLNSDYILEVSDQVEPYIQECIAGEMNLSDIIEGIEEQEAAGEEVTSVGASIKEQLIELRRVAGDISLNGFEPAIEDGEDDQHESLEALKLEQEIRRSANDMTGLN